MFLDVKSLRNQSREDLDVNSNHDRPDEPLDPDAGDSRVGSVRSSMSKETTTRLIQTTSTENTSYVANPTENPIVPSRGKTELRPLAG